MTAPAPAKRGRGRPRLREGEATVELRVQVPASLKADAEEAAKAAGEYLSDVVRAGVERELTARERAAKRGAT